MKKLTLILSAFLLSILVYSQEGPLSVSVGSANTAGNESAISVELDFFEILETVFDTLASSNPDGLSFDYSLFEKNYLFDVSPEVKFQTGTEDAFTEINAKISGIFMFWKKETVVDGITTIDTRNTFHTFPISAGIESTQDFYNLNGILEFGWTPASNFVNSKSKILNYIKFGTFLQGGYKFELRADTNIVVNDELGNIDQSKENPNDPIFRSKTVAKIDTKRLFVVNDKSGVGLIGEAIVWYDFINSETYYKIEGKLRAYLTKDKFIDFKYQKGSGAPNFNQGDQYGVGLTVQF